MWSLNYFRAVFANESVGCANNANNANNASNASRLSCRGLSDWVIYSFFQTCGCSCARVHLHCSVASARFTNATEDIHSLINTDLWDGAAVKVSSQLYVCVLITPLFPNSHLKNRSNEQTGAFQQSAPAVTPRGGSGGGTMALMERPTVNATCQSSSLMPGVEP